MSLNYYRVNHSSQYTVSLLSSSLGMKTITNLGHRLVVFFKLQIDNFFTTPPLSTVLWWLFVVVVVVVQCLCSPDPGRSAPSVGGLAPDDCGWSLATDVDVVVNRDVIWLPLRPPDWDKHWWWALLGTRAWHTNWWWCRYCLYCNREFSFSDTDPRCLCFASSSYPLSIWSEYIGTEKRAATLQYLTRFRSSSN